MQKYPVIGTSEGLVSEEFFGKGCEQLYVRETGDNKRPIRIEFWEGYDVPNTAILTRDQAVEMAKIILKWVRKKRAEAQAALDEQHMKQAGLRD